MELNLEADAFPYPSRRQPVIARRGVVATSEPLAAQAGLQMLQRGGNAVDAALATAIALTVIEPTSNGIGSDAFALVWDGARMHGLNASGRSPASHTPAFFASKGLDQVPANGWLPVTVPGAPAAWRDLHAKFGRLPFEVLFEPAISYATDGFPVGPVTASGWRRTQMRAPEVWHGQEFRGWYDTFAPGGRMVSAGDMWAFPDHAATLREIASTGAESFYRGRLAREIAAFASVTGGTITEADLAAHSSTWVDPIVTDYRGYGVWEIPPNGQGIACLMALNILEGTDLASHARESVESYHLQIEAMKLAFADARRFVADQDHVDVPVSGMLDKDYAARRRALMDDKAGLHPHGEPVRGGTVYLCATDADGMMISMIQSNFAGFGSGVVVPGTGIALQNRGSGFTLQEGHPNQVAPGKRPFHTIIPAFLTEGRNVPIGPFGVMGGHMQPQGHTQMVVNQVDYGLNPQSALDAPRWQWMRGRAVTVETGVADHIVQGLRRRGHE
ncbi:MAG: gamma-glutamyltransferase family protein, partial [Proteobacteria bacterium]|nr:gamma-glutamyltransferase family protein [Pseudomonadota bacterium]